MKKNQLNIIQNQSRPLKKRRLWNQPRLMWRICYGSKM